MSSHQARVARVRLKLLLLSYEPAYRLGRRARALARYSARKPHEPDFGAFRHFETRKLFVDVGANTGQSALSFRVFRRDVPILSIEANDYHERDLRFLKRIVPRFDYMICAVGEAETVTTLHIPTFRGVPITGQASIVRLGAENPYWLSQHVGTPESGDFEIIEKRVRVRPLDDLALEPGFVKIDVEGAELAVLRGAEETLRKHAPVVMVERNPLFADVRDFVAVLGYEPFAYRSDEDRFEPYAEQESQNVFLVPDELRLAAER